MPFNSLRRINKESNKVESTFNHQLSVTNMDAMADCADIAVNEAAKNNDLIPFILDNFGVGKEVSLSEIERLLSKYKGVDCDLVDRKQPINTTGFQTASGCTISNSQPKENQPKDALRERILSEIVETNLNVTWDDIVGLSDVKQAINEMVLWPLMRPDIFTGLRNPPRGLLLFGPPGTGKTMIGRCIASQVKATFFSISASSLTSKWAGEGERMVRTLFEMAREMAPSIIFVDEIDSLLSQRTENENEGSRRIKTEFLVQFDGTKTDGTERILLVGATNRPHEIDDAARRRLVKRIYVPLPCAGARGQLISKLVGGYANELSGHEAELVELTVGYSGSDIFSLCREACLEPLREIGDISDFRAECARPIGISDFAKAARAIRKSVSESDLDLYSKFNSEFGAVGKG